MTHEPTHHHDTRDSDRDRGSALEAVIGGMTFTLIVVLLAVGYVMRSDANLVERAAREAARTAAAQQAPATAAATADAAAHATLDGACAAVTVSSDLIEFRAGGTVTVTVTCAAPLAWLGPFSRGQRTLTAAATEVVDLYRGGT